jgi:hypothetical protein
VTDREIRLLRALCRPDQTAYLPQESSVAALQEFDALVALLQQWKKAGWIQLEVVRSGRKVKGYRRRYTTAAAPYTRDLAGGRTHDGIGDGPGSAMARPVQLWEEIPRAVARRFHVDSGPQITHASADWSCALTLRLSPSPHAVGSEESATPHCCSRQNGRG